MDDRPENPLDVRLQSSTRAALVWNGDPGNVLPNPPRFGTEPVRSTAACLERLATAARPPGLMSRLERMVDCRPRTAPPHTS